MKILITAGNTQSPIDRVRCITNIFSGRTGAAIATAALSRGHEVTLVTSRPDAIDPAVSSEWNGTWTVRPYRTFDDLQALLAEVIPGGMYDAVVHAAAVSDYSVTGVFSRGRGGEFSDVSAGKIKGAHPELWLRLEPTPKLVDRIRRDWAFSGTLVKFKLEVDVTDDELLAVAESSRLYSGADLMVANTLDGMSEWAFVGAMEYVRVRRPELPSELLNRVEALG